ncbi:MAG: hypothetical protein LBR82_09095 [Desulfovibrio sp.]|nr:hypothetical protein [Desulfovibrio sp.]
MQMKALFGVMSLLLFAAAGCASGPVGRLMPHIETVDLAKSYFGQPTSSQVLAGVAPIPQTPAGRYAQSSGADANAAGTPFPPPTPGQRSMQSANTAENATVRPAFPQTVANRSEQSADATALPPGARVEYEWLLDDVTTVPGQDVVERFLVGRDRQGFPVYYERVRWVPAHKARRFCRVRLLADDRGRILSRSVEGNDCEDLLIRPSTF